MEGERAGFVPRTGDEVLSEREVGTIEELRGRGWSVRRIARQLGVARNTVRRWLRRGNEVWRAVGRPRVLDEHESWLREQYEAGVVNGDVLRQQLVERGVVVSLRTVERAVAPWREEARTNERATVRFETAPGTQMQIDFGEAWVNIAGEREKIFIFVATLGYSRRIFVRVFRGMRQVHWLEGVECAIRHFGGAPEECVVDNAAALVIGWQGGRPVFHPEFFALCEHYGMRPRACRPYRARTKGKVESSVGYVKKNALGRVFFSSFEALENHLEWWMREIADVREHGTTHERPIDRFGAESAALQPVTRQPYRSTRRLIRRVSNDYRVEADTNRYSVPCRLVGRTVEVAIRSGELVVYLQNRPVAHHAVATGRYQDVADPQHDAGLVRTGSRGRATNELERPLSEYAAAGGGSW